MPLHAETVVKAFVEFGNVKVEYKEFYEFNVLKSGKHFSFFFFFLFFFYL